VPGTDSHTGDGGSACDDARVNRRRLLSHGLAWPLAGWAAACSSGSTGSPTSGAPGSTTATTSPVTTSTPTLADLAGSLRGLLLRPGAAGYAAAATVYNARFAGVRPQAVAVVADAADVAACIRFAARTSTPIRARSGGHSYAGYSTTTGLVCDLGRLDGISIAADGRSVTAGAGCRLIDVVAALAARGLAVPAGSCPTVGLGGLVQGGGVGFAARAFGTTSDNLLAATVVTAAGQVVTASSGSHPDLYWALRGGGGGNFGIATSFTLATHPVGAPSYAFVDFDWVDAAGAVAAWQRLAPTGPDGLYAICSLGTGQDGPVVRILAQLLDGGESTLRLLLSPLAAAGGRISTGTASYLAVQQIWAGCEGASLAGCAAFQPAVFAARSAYVATPFTPTAVAGLLARIEARQAAAGSGFLLLDPYGGALNRPAADATAFVHRDQLFSCQYGAYWSQPGAGVAAEEWLDSMRAALAGHVSGQAYQNYIDPTLPNWETAYYAGNLPRLQEAKRRYDPDGLFHFRQSIRT